MSIFLVYIVSQTIFHLSVQDKVVPRVQYAAEGDYLRFHCDSHTPPKWFKYGSSSELKGNKFTLELKDITVNDGGQYTCHGTQISNNGELHDFEGTVNAYVGTYDEGQVYGRQPIVPAGITAILECDSEDSTKWFYQDTHSEVISDNNMLVLYSVTPADSGTYMCFGKYKEHDYYFVGETTLEVVDTRSYEDITDMKFNDRVGAQRSVWESLQDEYNEHESAGDNADVYIDNEEDYVKIECPVPPRIENGHVIIPCLNVSCYIEYKCLPNYIPEGGMFRKCLSSGMWSGVEPKCIEKLCPVVPNPMYGYVEYSHGQHLGSEVQYYCNEGYTLIGKDYKATCLKGYVWSSIERPYCNHDNVKHDQYYIPNYMKDVGSEDVSFSSQSTSKNKGFRRKTKNFFGGTKKKVRPRYIKHQKGQENKSDILSCPKLTLQNGTIVQNGTKFGSLARFKCHKGFTLIGRPISTCMQNQTWSGKLPLCRNNGVLNLQSGIIFHIYVPLFLYFTITIFIPIFNDFCNVFSI